MVIKILSSAATFAGVSYNTDKIDRDKGELMRVSGFGPLQALGKLSGYTADIDHPIPAECDQ
jgi:hypothetical protein